MSGVSAGATPTLSQPPRTSFSGLAALFGLCLRQFARGRRLIILCALFALPPILAGVLRWYNVRDNPDEFAFGLLLNLVPHALLPLVALVYSTGMIQDEVEEQTLTYLLVRPLPRWAIYAFKLLTAWLVTVAITAVFVTLTYLVLYWGRTGAASAILSRAPATVLLLALASAAYCSVFGLLSLLVKRSLVAGIAYVVVLEVILANIDFALRRITVMYYFRVLALRWIPIDTPDVKDWEIKLAEAPGNGECIAILLGVSALVTLLACRVFSFKEFRVKTPEGS